MKIPKHQSIVYEFLKFETGSHCVAQGCFRSLPCSDSAGIVGMHPCAWNQYMHPRLLSPITQGVQVG